MREGSLDAPTRHPIDWQSPDFLNPEKLDAEMRRQFDICHGCRRCFNLCESFPRLFDLADNQDQEVDGIASSDFKHIVDGCTLCDMCFLTKCPYVPPHEFNIDFPHLMLRYRAFERSKKSLPFFEKQLTETDRNGAIASAVPTVANWSSRRGNIITRPALEAFAGVHKSAELPKFHAKTLVARAEKESPTVNTNAPAYGRKAALFATCFSNYNDPNIGMAALHVLTHNGVQTDVVYPGCCGMPQLEQGDIARVAAMARTTAASLKPYIDEGVDIISIVPSCTLMMKFEWPLIVPDDKDVERLAKSVSDIAEYIVSISENEGTMDIVNPADGPIALHLACHSRALNVGQKSAEMLRAIPGAKITLVERCSGHGGSWGIKKKNFDVATKFGKKTVRKMVDSEPAHVCSECPLAGKHIEQISEGIEENISKIKPSIHPIQLLAQSYGFKEF